MLDSALIGSNKTSSVTLHHENVGGNETNRDNNNYGLHQWKKTSLNGSASTTSHHLHQQEPNSPNNDNYSDHLVTTTVIPTMEPNSKSKIIATPIFGRRKETESDDKIKATPQNHHINHESYHFVTPNPRVPVNVSRALLDKHPHRDEIESLLELSSGNCCETANAVSEESPQKPPTMNAKILSLKHQHHANEEMVRYSTPPTSKAVVHVSKQSNLTLPSTSGNHERMEENSCRAIPRNSSNSSSNKDLKQNYLQTISTLRQIRNQLKHETAKAKAELQQAKQHLEQAKREENPAATSTFKYSV